MRLLYVDFKQRLVEHQEDKDQMENFQTQELGKVKHLVLLREQELAEKSAALKEATQQLDKLKSEMTRLRRQEEILSDVQVRNQVKMLFLGCMLHLFWHVHIVL